MDQLRLHCSGAEVVPDSLTVHTVLVSIVTEPVAVRRLHCSCTRGEPIRYKSCYAFLAGTEIVPAGGAESVAEQCRR